MTQVLIGLGSNIEPGRNLARAAGRLAALGRVVASSRAWRTPPVGVAGGEFLNAALILELASAGLGDLRHRLHAIEEELGRPRDHDPWAARPIDLDVLAVRGGDWHVVEPGLGEQAFQLLPALELVPGLVLPDGRRASAALAARPLRDARPMGKKIFQSLARSARPPRRRRPGRRTAAAAIDVGPA